MTEKNSSKGSYISREEDTHITEYINKRTTSKGRYRQDNYDGLTVMFLCIATAVLVVLIATAAVVNLTTGFWGIWLILAPVIAVCLFFFYGFSRGLIEERQMGLSKYKKYVAEATKRNLI